jgi:hypothetical protein
MSAAIPPQRNRCPVHDWCTATGRRHQVHTGDAHALTTTRGVELRMMLAAEGDHPPVVQVEVSFEPTGPLMHLTELEPSEARRMAELLGRVGRAAQPAARTR